ncbi:MAG TPA: hypothetical protein DDZ88_03370 [Verrucomicrobiales bacterium]|nr:hypothetical protein [Verrucomicrobiales bacterium]
MSIEVICTLVTAVTSIIAILLAVYSFWFQTRQANRTLGIIILRDCERDFFYSTEMRRRRFEAARFLMTRQPGQSPPQACYELLDFIDCFGIYVNRGLIEPELAWNTFYYWFSVYWHSLSKEVDELNEQTDGVPYLWNCHMLYSRLTKWGERHKRLPSETLRYAPERLQRFFADELSACRDACESTEPTPDLPVTPTAHKSDAGNGSYGV